jgi:hypothetical protein
MDVQNDHPKELNIDFHPFWSKQKSLTLLNGDKNNTP